MTESFGAPWLAASAALGLHVLDEARHDFLGWYNPQALRIRRVLGGFPFPPTFTYWPWMLGLLAAVTALLALTPAAFHGSPRLRLLAVIVGIEHCVNGMLHLGAAALRRRAVPGVLSAPLLLATGAWLLIAVLGA